MRELYNLKYFDKHMANLNNVENLVKEKFKTVSKMIHKKKKKNCNAYIINYR